MEPYKVSQREFSIVLVGKFDPLTMTPHWFVKNRLIPQEDLDENLAIELVYKELTKFSIANISIEIQQGILVLRSDHASFDYRVHDLAFGILAILKDVECSALGINIYTDLLFESSDFWHKIGDLIAPKPIWKNAFPESPRIGMANVQMQLNKPEREFGVYNFTVSWLETPNAIRFSLNNHFDNKVRKFIAASPDRKQALVKDFDPLSIVSVHWEQSLKFHEQIVSSILAQAEEE